MLLLIAFAFLAGIVTVLSPCILPVLPIILSSGLEGTKSRPFGVIVGFIASFTFFTLFLATIVRATGISVDTLRFISVIVIFSFGVSLLVPKIQQIVEILFSRFANFIPQAQGNSGFFGGILIGLSLGLLWTPCVGPILASVISLALIGQVTLQAFLVTLAYSMGTAIPMFAVMLFGRNLFQKIPWLFASTTKIQKIFGILMILTALAVAFKLDKKFQVFVLDTFPKYSSTLTTLEQNKSVITELEKMRKD